MKLWKNAWNMFKITATMQTNSFIHLLRSVPVLSVIVPERLYRRTGLKYLFSLGGLVTGCIGGVLGSTVLCLLYFQWLPGWLGMEPSPGELLWLCFLVKSLAPALRSCSIFRAGQQDYVFLNHFMMNPTEYYHYKIGKEALENVITMLPVVIYVFRDAAYVLAAVSAELFCTLAGCCLYLFLYERQRRKKAASDSEKIFFLSRKVRYTVSFGLIFITYIGLKQQWFAGIAFSAPFCLGMSLLFLAASVVCYAHLLRYREYKWIAVQFANKETMLLTVSITTGGEEGRNALSGFSSEKNKAFYEANKEKSQAEYLNKAFFVRFRRIFSNQRGQILWMSTGLGLLFGFLIRNGVLDITSETMMNYTPVLIALVNSLMLFGARFTMLCFQFVDMPMLYQRICGKKYLQESIRCRYFFLVRHSLVALAGLAVFVGLILLLGGLRVSAGELVRLFITMELFMLFNEVYNLLIYYGIQPYTMDVSVKSPVYKVLGVLESLFDISVLFLRGNLANAWVPMLVLVLLVHMLLWIVAGRAERTFRLRY